MSEDAWDLLMDVNLGAIVRIQETLTAPDGPMRDGGRLVLLSSIAGLAGTWVRRTMRRARPPLPR